MPLKDITKSPKNHISVARLFCRHSASVSGWAPALAKQIAEPRVVVTSNFDVHVQAETYPAAVLSKLVPLCETVSEGASIILKLNKQKVAAARAADPKLDAAGLLQTLSGGELPANVARELSVLVRARREIRVV